MSEQWWLTEKFDNNKRNDIIAQIENMFKPKCEGVWNLHPNWTRMNRNGYCDFTIYDKNANTRIEGMGSRVVYALPSLIVALHGFLVQGYQPNNRITYEALLSIRAQIVYEWLGVKYTQAEIICDIVRKPSNAHVWNEFGHEAGKGIEAPINYYWGEGPLEAHMEKVHRFLNDRFEDWMKANQQYYQKCRISKS